MRNEELKNYPHLFQTRRGEQEVNCPIGAREATLGCRSSEYLPTMTAPTVNEYLPSKIVGRLPLPLGEVSPLAAVTERVTCRRYLISYILYLISYILYLIPSAAELLPCKVKLPRDG